jgi:hypothetical protein
LERFHYGKIGPLWESRFPYYVKVVGRSDTEHLKDVALVSPESLLSRKGSLARLGMFFYLPRHFQFALTLRRFFFDVLLAEELAEAVLEFIEIHVIDGRDVKREGLREYQAADHR